MGNNTSTVGNCRRCPVCSTEWAYVEKPRPSFVHYCVNCENKIKWKKMDPVYVEEML